MSRGQLKLFSGSAHPALTAEIAEFLGVSIGHARLQRFPDTECSFQIDENIRGTDVFVVQPTCADVDRNIMELCVMIDAFRRSSASRITAVIPYYGYARQDRKDKPRVPISAKLVANLLSAAGANRVLTMDLHKAQIQGFFDIPVDHLFAAPVIIDYCSRLGIPNLTIVSPDAGGAERARAYAKRLGAELAIIDKRRTDDGTAEVMNVIGDVDGRTCILQDDIIDTAGTIVKAATALKAERGGAGVRVRGPRRAVGSGDGAARGGADRAGDHHQHDPAAQRAGEVLQEDQAAVGGTAAGPGDPQHSRRDVGEFVVCVVVAASYQPSSRASSANGETESRTAESWIAGNWKLSMASSTLQAEKRETRGKNEARRLRASGKIPAVLYGAEKGKATEISVDPKVLLRILHSESGVNTLIGLEGVGAADTRVLVKEYQLDPITHKLLHVDFFQVAMDKMLTVTVPILLKGDAKGVKQQGGIVDFVNREIEIETLPGDIPENITVDISRADAEPGPPRPRPAHRGREVEAGHRRRHDDRPRRGAEGRGAGA